VQPVRLPSGSFRDLRTVLKCGSLGISKPPPSPMPRVSGDQVLFLRPGVISSCGLLPLSEKPTPEVHTEFSGDWWVIRPFEVSELLASRDIPEPLSMSMLDDKEREALLMTCLVPLKCQSYAVDYLRQLWLPIAEASMKDPGLSVLDSGPTDAGASPALEEDRPVLLPDASVLSRVPAALELDAGPDRNAKACKDDKAKAPTYMWDKWTLPLCALTNPNAPLLCLDWKRGFRSLREAMLRFWSAVFFEVSCSIGVVRSFRAVGDSLRRSYSLLVIVSSVLVFALFGSGTEVLDPSSGIGSKNFGKIWSRGCACGSRKVWSRGPGGSDLLMTISVLLCLTRSISFGSTLRGPWQY